SIVLFLLHPSSSSSPNSNNPFYFFIKSKSTFFILKFQQPIFFSQSTHSFRPEFERKVVYTKPEADLVHIEIGGLLFTGHPVLRLEGFNQSFKAHSAAPCQHPS
ncbi:hypothetical protein A2U01_0062167, partial [Trifolium medium]|nr:hypothetical protein [Trifolium medium]